MPKLSEILAEKLKEKNSLASQVEAELPKPKKKSPTKKKTATKKPKSKVAVDRKKNKPQLATEIGTLAKSTKVPIETLRSIYFMLKVMDER